jgi:hypothetical protein
VVADGSTVGETLSGVTGCVGVGKDEEMKSEKKQKAVSTSKSRVERRCDKRQTRRDWTLDESRDGLQAAKTAAVGRGG